jgi:hypothetical protein
MRKWMLISMCLTAIPAWAGVPQQITYQGTLKQSGAAANGTYTMTFRLTDSAGLTQYWSSGPVPVAVSQGLFSAILSPTGVDWANITPYIEVNVGGQVLLPRDPVTSTAYALECGSVLGMIAMFAGSCPTGWTRFAALDGLFPMGGATYGATGGSATHSHSLLIYGTAAGSNGGAIGTTQGQGTALQYFAGGSSVGIDLRSADTNPQSNLPPYRSVVFCQKQ